MPRSWWPDCIALKSNPTFIATPQRRRPLRAGAARPSPSGSDRRSPVPGRRDRLGPRRRGRGCVRGPSRGSGVGHVDEDRRTAGHLGHRRPITGQHRRLAGHRLERRHPESLVDARVRDARPRCSAPGGPGPTRSTGAHDLVPRGERLVDPRVDGSLVPRTGTDEHERVALGKRPGQRAEGVDQADLVLAGLDVADRHQVVAVDAVGRLDLGDLATGPAVEVPLVGGGPDTWIRPRGRS